MSSRGHESDARLERLLAERTSELREAIQQQTATAEILKAISSSPGDLRPVFDTILEKVTAICDADLGMLHLYRDGKQRTVAHRGGSEAFARWLFTRGEFRPPPGSANARAMTGGKPVHIEDYTQTDVYRSGDPLVEPLVSMGGIRTYLNVPMVRDGQVMGAIAIYRCEVRPFTEKQIGLVSTFADQALIAIENVRLFNETREALERQTATADILKVISANQLDVQPVFEAIVRNAASLFAPRSAGVLMSDGQLMRLAAMHGPLASAGAHEKIGQLFPMPLDGNAASRAIREIRVVEVQDAQAETSHAVARQAALALGYRSMTNVPLVRDGTGIGVIILVHPDADCFLTAKQLELVNTFADQAVIAIENVRLFNEIKEKGRQLEAANKHKSEFLANMSHELRTPLNAIIGFSEVLQDDMFGTLNGEQKEFIGDIHESGKHLLSLINDILDLSKVESGRTELMAAEFDLPSAIGNAMTLMKELAIRNRIALTSDVDATLATVRADERKLKQILLNLLSNAVKFTPEGGKVRVSARPRGNGIEISVADTGVGIAEHERDAVFEQFRQVGSDYTRKAEGTGLGLTLARKFAELHGGAITLESEPGKGSTFTVFLPDTFTGGTPDGR